MWKVEIDGRGLDEDEFLSWIRSSCSGDAAYMKTQFADKNSKTHCVPNRKRNFDDGYLLYSVWFARKADAALCRMFWEFCREDS